MIAECYCLQHLADHNLVLVSVSLNLPLDRGSPVIIPVTFR